MSDSDEVYSTYAEDLIDNTLAIQRAKRETYYICVLEGLPIPPDLKKEIEDIGNYGEHPQIIPCLEPGDILHVRVGVEDLGDGMGPWIPSKKELKYIAKYWQAYVPEGVKVAVTNFSENPQIIKVK